MKFSYIRVTFLTTILWYLYWYLPSEITQISQTDWLNSQIVIQIGDLILYSLVFILGILCNSFLREKRSQYWRLKQFFTSEWPIRSDHEERWFFCCLVCQIVCIVLYEKRSNIDDLHHICYSLSVSGIQDNQVRQ